MAPPVTRFGHPVRSGALAGARPGLSPKLRASRRPTAPCPVDVLSKRAASSRPHLRRPSFCFISLGTNGPSPRMGPCSTRCRPLAEPIDAPCTPVHSSRQDTDFHLPRNPKLGWTFLRAFRPLHRGDLFSVPPMIKFPLVRIRSAFTVIPRSNARILD